MCACKIEAKMYCFIYILHSFYFFQPPLVCFINSPTEEIFKKIILLYVYGGVLPAFMFVYHVHQAAPWI